MRLFGFLGAVISFFTLAYALQKQEATNSLLVEYFWILLIICMFPILVVCLFWFLFY